MGWVVRERASVVVGSPRRPMAPLRLHKAVRGRRSPGSALRGATTLEDQALPLVIMVSFAALATIQLILTW
jgi:hypothetical protein